MSCNIALCVVVRDNKLLLLQRGMTAPTMPGVWSIPGGHKEEGEKLLFTAIRELKEETNLDVLAFSYVGEKTNTQGKEIKIYSFRVHDDAEVTLSYEQFRS